MTTRYTLSVITAIIGFFCLAIMAGCAGTMYTPRTSVEVETDSFSGQTKLLGIEKKFGPPTNVSYHMIRTMVDENGNIENQLYVVHRYGSPDWRFYEDASFEGDETAQFTRIDRDVLGCSAGSCEHEEIFGVLLPSGFLKENKGGFRVKFYADSGDELVLNVTGNQVSKQLSEIKDYN